MTQSELIHPTASRFYTALRTSYACHASLAVVYDKLCGGVARARLFCDVDVASRRWLSMNLALLEAPRRLLVRPPRNAPPSSLFLTAPAPALPYCRSRRGNSVLEQSTISPERAATGFLLLGSHVACFLAERVPWCLCAGPPCCAFPEFCAYLGPKRKNRSVPPLPQRRSFPRLYVPHFLSQLLPSPRLSCTTVTCRSLPPTLALRLPPSHPSTH
ncbi:hypothetical protein C8R45DRAFT_1217365, partial [Mycena sanguinolenta]